MNFRFITLMVVLISFETAIAQTLPVIWEQKMSPGATKIKMHSKDDALFIGSGEKFITAFHAADGSIVWSYKFEEKFGIKSFEWQEWNRENGVILLGNSDDNSIKIFIDEKTGNELWRTDKLSEFKKYAFNESFTNCFVNELHAFPIIGGAACAIRRLNWLIS
ncbi:PQQ-like beta-propeller repeat protein [bacterium]|nr:PQQ-like beta-propeller repeat protein [bacterium]